MHALPLPNGKPSFLVRAALAAAVLLASAEPAIAAKKSVVDITTSGELKFYEASGGNYGSLPSALDYLTDGDLTRGVSIGDNGVYFVLDFSDATSTPEPMMYVDEIVVGHAAESRMYSLYVSADKSTWTPVAENVTTSGETSYPVKDRIIAVKYVFVLKTANNTLGEFHVWGYKSSVPKVISDKNHAKFYKSNGTMVGNNGTDAFGGGTTIANLFNSNFTENVYIGPNGRLDNGGYMILDFSGDGPADGWFITEIAAGNNLASAPYSLYYSMDGATWETVPGATNVNVTGKQVFNVNDTAKYVKCVFVKVGGWTASFNELQVWGMNPDDVACTHPSFTEWTFVEGTATCLVPGIEEQFCSVCGERFTRTQPAGLGHDFVSHLLVPGAYRKFGSGYIDCSRCDWRLDFPLDPNNLWDTMPLDLVTNRVNGTQIGRISLLGQFNFTEITVTSTGNGASEPDPNQNWGVNPVALFDNKWDWSWQNYWYSLRASLDPDPHVDYVFGTEIDLAWIDFSTDNANYTNRFFSVDDATGEETLLAETSALTADETHQESVEEIVFTRVSFSQTADEEPVAGKTYYALEVVGEGANARDQWTPVSGLAAFEEGTQYFEPTATGAVWCTKDGDNYVQIATPAVFTSDVEYYAQSATTEDNYYTESSGLYVSAGKRTSFATNTTYYRTTGVTTGNNLATIFDAHSDVTRLRLRFYAQPVKHLRLRQVKPDGNVRAPMYVSELRPWGTVKGAGDLRYRKETLMIFR